MILVHVLSLKTYNIHYNNFFFFYYGDARMINHAHLYTKKKLRNNFFFYGFLSINNAFFL